MECSTNSESIRRRACSMAEGGVAADLLGPTAVAVEHHPDVLGESLRRQVADNPALVDRVEEALHRLPHPMTDGGLRLDHGTSVQTGS